MKLKNIQECITVKFFLLIFTLILGAASIFFIFHAIPFLEKYSPSDTVFTQTDPFLSLYKQYLDRVAVYTKYREAGYFPDPSSFYSKADLIAMFNGKTNGNLIPSDDVYNMSQESFEYYNYILNQNNPDFFTMHLIKQQILSTTMKLCLILLEKLKIFLIKHRLHLKF